jgi:uncharacterized repeat protein (TIGR04076 family)
MRYPVRITVLRRLYHKELYEQYGQTLGAPCTKVADGQEFLVDLEAMMPEGFCSWAWTEIFKYVLVLARGGDLHGSKPGVFVACCGDGYRPVLFKLERVAPA